MNPTIAPFAIGSGFYAVGIMYWLGLITVSTSHLIVASTGIGYATVGTLSLLRLDVNNAFIWLGYAAAQIGLYRSIPE